MGSRRRSIATGRVLSLAVIGVVLHVMVNQVQSATPVITAAAQQQASVSPGKGMPLPLRHPTLASRAGYIVPRVSFLATIFHAIEEHQSLVAGDHVLIDAGVDRDVQVGDWVTMMRTSSPLHHPVTGHPMGTRVTILGYATVLRVQPSTAILWLRKTFDAVAVGDQVAKFVAPQPQGMPVTASLPAREIQGLIVATQDDRASVAAGDIVYIDRGQKHGVHIGDHFDVLQESETGWHPLSHHRIRLPRQILGELVVLKVRDLTSTAVVIASRRELSAGAPVALHPPATRRLTEAKATHTREGGRPPPETWEAAHLAQGLSCLDAAHQALHTAAAAGATPAALAPAIHALRRAEQQLERARTHLTHGEVKRARHALQAAQKDCLTAHELSRQTTIRATSRSPAAPDHYTVQRGDTLWGISAQATIYHNPFMWPLLYQANRQQINDPDLIFPRQRFIIPRHSSREEVHTVIERARRRGPWRLGDGADVYILEGRR